MLIYIVDTISINILYFYNRWIVTWYQAHDSWESHLKISSCDSCMWSIIWLGGRWGIYELVHSLWGGLRVSIFFKLDSNNWFVSDSLSFMATLVGYLEFLIMWSTGNLTHAKRASNYHLEWQPKFYLIFIRRSITYFTSYEPSYKVNYFKFMVC